MNTLHLTEEQLDDFLLGDSAEGTTTHLETCLTCRERVAEMQSAIQDFTAITLSWSERRSATMPPQPVIEGPAWNHKLNWALAAGLVVVTAIVLPLATRNTSSMKLAATDEAQVTQPQAQPTAAASTHTPLLQTASATTVPAKTDVVAQDNQMLQAIDQELATSMDSPTQVFGGDAPQGGGAKNHGLPIPISD